MTYQVDVNDRYAIEISGWNLSEDFFVEQGELVWDSAAHRVQLKHPVREGALVFIRLAGNGVDGLQSDIMPVPYEVVRVNHFADQRVYEIELVRIKPKPMASEAEELVGAAKQEVLQ